MHRDRAENQKKWREMWKQKDAKTADFAVPTIAPAFGEKTHCHACRGAFQPNETRYRDGHKRYCKEHHPRLSVAPRTLRLVGG